jgi:hypothetical protein
VTASARAEAPPSVRIDLADVLDRVRSTDRPPLDAELLEQARRSAAGASNQPARRELIAVALREVAREQQRRGEVEAALVHTRETRRQLLMIQAELVGALATQLGCDPDPKQVLARIRATRPSLERAVLVDAHHTGVTP